MKLHVGGDTPLLNPRDLNFPLYEWLDVESLCAAAQFDPFDSPDRSLIELTERWL